MHSKLKSALCSDRITPKRSIENSPYVLVYGKEARIPISVEFPSLSLIQELEMMEEEPFNIRYAELLELEEKRRRHIINLENHHTQMNRTFDKKAISRVFREGDLVFKWNELKSKPGQHTKSCNVGWSLYHHKLQDAQFLSAIQTRWRRVAYPSQ